MQGIPTMHGGRKYRSRLEAKWACFFDLLGWKYEYEPFDLDGWIPDFILIGKTPTLVEVKPITLIDKSNVHLVEKTLCCREFEVLILGVRPCLMYEHTSLLGWHTVFRDFPNYAPEDKFWDANIVSCEGSLDCQWDWSSVDGQWFGRLTGADHRSMDLDVDPDEILSMWNTASNAVQWNARA